ncbi:DUF397 domain-containing protein [Streptomyces sp. NPDC046203]|uniref:DUF397 domain-containing protein n=1 Tax=Streptomyces sp. NPDC046203 TaxID=3154602 RepID=UPI0033E8C95A
MTTETPQWFKSSYSDTGGACVEVATNLVAASGIVPVRDSKDLTGPVLDVSSSAFASFVAGVKGDGFDLV